jgi:hypothetical protein
VLLLVLVVVLPFHIRQSISALSVCNIKEYNSNDYNAPYVKEDELTKPLSLIKRMIKLPFIYPVKVSMIYSNIQLSFVDDIPITCNSKALESYEIVIVERVCKRRHETFLYHVRKVNSYVFEF